MTKLTIEKVAQGIEDFFCAIAPDPKDAIAESPHWPRYFQPTCEFLLGPTPRYVTFAAETAQGVNVWRDGTTHTCTCLRGPGGCFAAMMAGVRHGEMREISADEAKRLDAS